MLLFCCEQRLVNGQMFHLQRFCFNPKKANEMQMMIRKII